MSTLFNTSSHAIMNDISVTTGNADGWVLVLRDSIGHAGESRFADARIENGIRPAKTSKNGTKRSKR